MERRQGVCALYRLSRSVISVMILCILVLACAAMASAQANTADLSGPSPIRPAGY